MDEGFEHRAERNRSSLLGCQLEKFRIKSGKYLISTANTHIHAHSYAEGRDFNDRSEIVSLRLPFNNIPVPLD